MADGEDMKIAVAYIRGPRGFKGELAAALYKPASRSLRPGLEIELCKGERTLDSRVEHIKFLNKGLGVKAAGIDDEESAANWKGGEILVDSENLEPLGKNEFYHFEIEGSEVFENGGKRIGRVKSVNDSAANTLLIIDTGDSEIMIPFVEALVRSVDTGNKRIVIEKIEGLY